jgi:hypothetical protein
MLRRWVLCIVLLALTACSQPSSSPKFEGKWQNQKQDVVLEIQRNGNSYIVVIEKDKFPATLKEDGILRVSGPIPFDATYEAKSDRLIALGDEFKRVK